MKSILITTALFVALSASAFAQTAPADPRDVVHDMRAELVAARVMTDDTEARCEGVGDRNLCGRLDAELRSLLQTHTIMQLANDRTRYGNLREWLQQQHADRLDAIVDGIGDCELRRRLRAHVERLRGSV